MDFREVQTADGVVEVDKQRVQISLDTFEIETGEVVHQLLDIGGLARYLRIDLLQLMESRWRRIRLKFEANEKNAGEQTVGLQASTQSIANTALHGAAREKIHTFITQALSQQRLVHFEDHRHRKITRG